MQQYILKNTVSSSLGRLSIRHLLSDPVGMSSECTAHTLILAWLVLGIAGANKFKDHSHPPIAPCLALRLAQQTLRSHWKYSGHEFWNGTDAGIERLVASPWPIFQFAE